MNYRVTIHQVLSGQTIVNAASEDEASELALNKLEESDFVEDIVTTYVQYILPLTDDQ